MNVKEIRIMVENGGAELNKVHLDTLLKRIDDASVIFERIKSIANNNDMHRDFSIIRDLTDVFLEGDK